eukprot:TRINITY_DN46362_c0_g1_i1.p1 TRINITY_DN46362_c0_g1~~TRINITY_DN46362_c0_g1_i1.p1  ORF type:complete len:468 (+),score=94.30 TRINITY_DN46362_c0_g1_i1:97-1500(+)
MGLAVVAVLASCLGLAAGGQLRQPNTEVLAHPSRWHLGAAPVLPPSFIIMASPQERKISYAQVGLDMKAVKGLVKPLIDGGISLPKGLAYDALRSRLYVADPGLRKIRSWRIALEPCYTPEQKAGVLGTGVSADPFLTDPAEGPNACDLEWRLVAKEGTTVVADVVTEWVSLDEVGNFYYSDQSRKTVNRIAHGLLTNLVHGEVSPADLKVRSSQEAQAIVAIEEGKKEMQVAPKATLDSVDSATDAMVSAGSKLAASIPEVSLISPMSEYALALYQGPDNPHVGTPAGVAADSVQVYWANQEGGLQKGTIGTGAANPENADSIGIQSGALTTKTDKAFGVVTTSSSVIFSDGSYGVYGVPKFGGGNATVMNEGFIISRDMAWDGEGTVFVADQGASMVYAMPSRVAENQPLFPVVGMNDVFGVALVKSTDPMVKTAVLMRGAAGRPGLAPAAAMVGLLLAAFQTAC